MMELLAPAGNLEALEAAVKAGADAVYMGGSAFNARQYAGNFDDDSLKYALDYAHLRGVKIYITVNTLVRDDEFEALAPYLEMLYASGADGVIVQDMGVASLIKRWLPGMPLHASTQMTVHNADGAAMLKSLGFKRVVPARELSLAEIAGIAKTGIEVEAFVHGAMCYAYSGQCLMSSFMGGRSGNRGRCAQPCRMPYSLVEEGGKASPPQYLLSMKDMCLIDELPALREAGASALKIEGRMKSPEYVAIVVAKYRKALDRMEAGAEPLADAEDKMQLMQAFNRGGFSKGYIHGKCGMDMVCSEKPDNWGVPLGSTSGYDSRRRLAAITLEAPLALGDGIEIRQDSASSGQIVTYMESAGKPIRKATVGQTVLMRVESAIPPGSPVYKTLDAELDKKVKASLKSAERRVALKAKVTLIEGEPPIIEIEDGDGNSVKRMGPDAVQAAHNAALQKERVIEQVKRVGDLPFEFSNIEADISPKAWMPIAALNALRRSALEEMARLRIDKKHRQPASITLDTPLPHRICDGRKPAIFAMVDSANLIQAAIDAGASGICLRVNAKEAIAPESARAAALCQSAGIPLIWALPRITRNPQLTAVKDALPRARGLYSGILVSDIGQLACVKEAGISEVYGDFSLNIFNSFAAQAYAGMGIKRFMPSLELTLPQIKALRSDAAIELMAYGDLPLMVAEGCPIGALYGSFSSTHPCSRPCLKRRFYLRDRKGELLPIRTYVDKNGCYIEIENAHKLCMADKINDLLSAHPCALRLNLCGCSTDEIGQAIELYRRSIDKRDEKTQCPPGKITRGHYYSAVE